MKFNWFRPHQEKELDAEIRSHLDEAIRDRINRGEAPDEARVNALREFGNVSLVKEVTRDIWGWASLDRCVQDLRFGSRMLWKNRSVSLIAVLSLALGIGANTAIFNIVDAALLKTLPVEDPEALVLFKSLAREDFSYGAFNGERSRDAATGLSAGHVFPNQSFARMREQVRTSQSTLSTLFAFGLTDANVASDGQAESLRGLVVSGNYYSGLGVQATLGRVISEDDDRSGSGPVVVLSYRYWERRFGNDPHVIGRQISLNNIPFTVIGVTPRGFNGTGEVGSAPEVFVPLSVEPQINPSRRRMVGAGWWWLRLMGRLKPGATAEQARAQLETVFQQSVVEHRSARQAQPLTGGRRPLPDLELKDSPRLGVDSGSRGELHTRQTFAPQLYLLFGIVGLVLLIACANVANLLLARGASRQREMAVRLALGAGRSRLIRQLLTESVLLAMLGAAAGLFFALWIKDVMLSVNEWGGAEMAALNPQLDLRALAFTFLLSLGTGIVLGVVPACRSTRLNLGPALKATGRNASSPSRSRLSKGLVVTQVAISFVLLVGAGLMLRTLRNLQNIEAGFDRDNLLIFSVAPGQLGYRGERLASLYRQLFVRLDAVPGARAVTCSSEALLSTGVYNKNVFVAGASVVDSRDNQQMENGSAQFLGVRENFLETMGIPLLRGRTLLPQDNERAPRTTVVNQAFAKRFFPDQNPIGKRFGLNADSTNQIEIVGLSADAKYTSLRDEIKPTFYIPWSQELSELRSVVFELRAAGEPGVLVAAVREAVRNVDSNLPVFDVKTQIAQSDETLRTERLFARLLNFFGVLALLLAGIGLYGVLAYGVTQRTHEIGIRMALGAQTRDVLLMVVRQGIAWTLIGVTVGVAVALWLTRLVESLLFNVKATDPLTFAITSLLLVCVAFLAAYLPARRASKADPLIALRHE